MCFSSFLYGPRANIIGTEVMGFIYTGFRPSHFEVMAVTDIQLVFIQILSHSQVTEAIVFFSLQLSSYIPSWRLQKNADGHISSLGDLWYGPSYQKYQKWREHELNISLDKVVSSCINVGAYHLHGQTGRIKETLNEWSLWHEMPWRLIKCRLSIHRYTLNLQIRFYQGLQVIMRCSLPLHHFVLLLLEFNQSVMLITIDTQSSLDESDSI